MATHKGVRPRHEMRDEDGVHERTGRAPYKIREYRNCRKARR